MRAIRKTRLLGVAAAALAAFAWSAPAEATPVACGPVMTVSGPGAWTSCTHGDKEFTHVSHDAGLDGMLLSFNASPGDTHILIQLTGVATGVYHFEYTVAIISGPNQFDKVQVSQTGNYNTPGLDTVVTKEIYSSTTHIPANLYGSIESRENATSTAVSVGDLALPNSVFFLDIVETITVGPGDTVGSVTNTFVQETETFSTNLPEPAALAVFGAGLLALGFARRRRTR